MKLTAMGFALWIDEEHGVCWAQGTHEYRPMGAAVTARLDRFRVRDFARERRPPKSVTASFAGFFGSLESVNEFLGTGDRPRLRRTPAHLL